MASKGNRIEAWDANPWTAPPNANAANAETMTSPQAQAARAKSAEVMAALKKGDRGEADRLMGAKQGNDSLLPGMGRLKDRIFGGSKKMEEEEGRGLEGKENVGGK